MNVKNVLSSKAPQEMTNHDNRYLPKEFNVIENIPGSVGNYKNVGTRPKYNIGKENKKIRNTEISSVLVLILIVFHQC